MTDGAAGAVRSHYEALGEIYRAAWGDSMHFAVFAGGEERGQAAAATERLLADEAGMRPGMSVLDVGCGTGGPTLAIAGHTGAWVTGIDLVPRQVARARARAAAQGLEGRTTFLVADATDMPFPDASFDAVYAMESAYHAADKARFYAECARVLRPRGRFVGTDWLRAEGAGGGDLERIRASFAIPELIDLPALRAHLVGSGLVPEVVEDLARRGDVTRNWEPLGVRAWPRLVRAGRDAPPDALRGFAVGARALADAASSGAFILGHWRARAPG